jgi:DNA-binding MarR family transcriptional regulator
MAETRSLLHEELRQSKPFPSLADEASVAVLRTADRVKRHLAQVVSPAGITLQQYNVLRILAGSHPDPLPTLEIAVRMIEATPAITGLLDRLEHKGLVRRERCPTDRRLVHCWISQEGSELLEELNPQMTAAADEAMKSLSESEQEGLVRVLERIRDGLKA